MTDGLVTEVTSYIESNKKGETFIAKRFFYKRFWVLSPINWILFIEHSTVHVALQNLKIRFFLHLIEHRQYMFYSKNLNFEWDLIFELKTWRHVDNIHRLQLKVG